MKFAAIDIGSNAIRMLFEEVFDTSGGIHFNKLSLIRLPVRLGEDAFVRGEISDENEAKLLSMAEAFKHLCAIYEVTDYRATATSAMRDSKNGAQIIEHINDQVGVKIDIIPGEEEAKILYESIFNTGKLNKKLSYMFIDVGGGSTEVNFYSKGERKKWKSFKIGTIRLKEGLVEKSEWDKFNSWIKETSKKYRPQYAVGTGGNINKLYKLCGHKNWENLDRDELKKMLDFLCRFSPEELVYEFDMKPDRADVIVEGGGIYMKAMKRAKINEMIVPKVGLPDGLIRRMYLEAVDSNK